MSRRSKGAKGRGRGGSSKGQGKHRKLVEGLVLSVLGRGYYVDVDGEEWFCRVRGRLFIGEGVTWPVVGDRVQVEPAREAKKGRIASIEPRRTTLSRLAPETHKQQVLAANLDRILICMAIKDPPFRPGLIDRYVLSAEALELEATLVVNKVDLATEDEIREAVQEFEDIGYEVIQTSTVENRGVEELRDRLRGEMSVLTGPSGAGKSSLANALFPHIELKTGHVNEVTGKGRHTTTASKLIDTGDGYIVDTPGIREFSLWGVTSEQLADCFVEFRPYLHGCRFRDCSHTVEPDCNLLAAYKEGEFSERRFQSFLQIHEELTDIEKDNLHASS